MLLWGCRWFAMGCDWFVDAADSFLRFIGIVADDDCDWQNDPLYVDDDVA